ncbi:MAG TPA: hypothetical protein PLD46_06475 [Hyphomicrobium sp.]|nr:hypothetical protein [Hyphomicrobium sp.]
MLGGVLIGIFLGILIGILGTDGAMVRALELCAWSNGATHFLKCIYVVRNAARQIL